MSDLTPDTLRGLEWNLSDDERRELHAHADAWEADRKRLEAFRSGWKDMKGMSDHADLRAVLTKYDPHTVAGMDAIATWGGFPIKKDDEDAEKEADDE